MDFGSILSFLENLLSNKAALTNEAQSAANFRNITPLQGRTNIFASDAQQALNNNGVYAAGGNPLSQFINRTGITPGVGSNFGSAAGGML